MAHPPTITPITQQQADLLAQLGAFVGGQGQPVAAVPASITNTWDTYTAIIGQTVPHNLRRARTAIRAIPGAGR